MTKTTHRAITPTGTYASEGDLATMSINADSYVVVIDKVSASGKTIVTKSCVKQQDGTWEENIHSKERTFRWNEKRQAFVFAKLVTLHLGLVRSHIDPHV